MNELELFDEMINIINLEIKKEDKRLKANKKKKKH